MRLGAGMAVLALIGVPVLLAGCGPRTGGEGASRTAGPAAAPSLVELKNGTYRGFEETADPVILVNGAWEGAPFAEGGASRPEIAFVDDFRLTGNLDGDPDEEAVVLLSGSAGGSGSSLYLAVVDPQDGRPVNVATALVGDRVQVRGASLEGNRIRLDVVQAGSEDAACCPGDLVSRTWELGQDCHLSEAGAPTPSGRLSLEVLSGAEWRLREWNFGVPAAAGAEVTLVFRDGRLAGSGGCNRYSASASDGQMPGDVKIGPAISTRMACPEPAAETEHRFLAILPLVTKYGFQAGRLALTYSQDGVWKTLLFEAAPEAAGSPS